ncbi:MAG: P-type conjugative transfer protein TrbG [Proteobacteria bacterium]|nr:P-type conjugative transfer protein TrbG [Pseudomonadota bacterium]
MKKEIISVATLLTISSCAPAQKALLHFNEAVKTPEVKEKIVVVPKPVPMPNQWKPAPVNEVTLSRLDLSPIDTVLNANEDSTHSPNSESMINSMTTYDYMPGALYQLYAAKYKVTSINLEPGEKLLSATAGDTHKWQLQQQVSGTGANTQVHVLLKPMQNNARTNLFLTTNRRTYSLELQSYDSTYMASVQWNYPQTLVINNNGFSDNNISDEGDNITNVNIDELDFNYKIKGKKYSWKPVRVYNDGAKTFIQFPKSVLTNEVPVLFVMSPDGETQLVNYRVKKDYFIVDKIFQDAQLVLGTKKQQIINIEKRS